MGATSGSVQDGDSNIESRVSQSGPMSRDTIRRASDVIFLAVVATAMACVFMFSRSNAKLTKYLDEAALSAYPRVGDYLPDVPAVLLGSEDHETLVLSASHLPAVIYFLAPDCKFCERQRQYLPDLISTARAHGYDFLAVSTAWPNETRKMFPHSFSFPVFAESGHGLRRSYRVEGTPMFIKVDANRRVEAVHPGVLQPEAFSAEIFPRVAR